MKLKDYKSLIEARAIELYLAGKVQRSPNNLHDCAFILWLDVAHDLVRVRNLNEPMDRFLIDRGILPIVHQVFTIKTATWSPRKIWKTYCKLKRRIKKVGSLRVHVRTIQHIRCVLQKLKLVK